MDSEQLLTMSASTNQPGVLVKAPPSAQQQYGAPQQLATSYQLPAAQQQPATMQQVPQAPIDLQAAPMQPVNQVAPQQYRGGNQVAYSAQQGGIAQIVIVSILLVLIAVMVCVLVWGGCNLKLQVICYFTCIAPILISCTCTMHAQAI